MPVSAHALAPVWPEESFLSETKAYLLVALTEAVKDPESLLWASF